MKPSHASDPAQKRRRRTQALADPVFFAETYVRPYDPNWKTDLEPFAREMLTFAITAKYGVIMLPPEFMKTTLVSQVYPLWLTFRYTLARAMLRGMLLSEEEAMATHNLSVIAWHILYNDRIRHDFSDDSGRPLVYPDPDENTWRDDAIIVNRPGVSKDPTWEAKSIDSKGIQGKRIDRLIGDDVVTPANAFSPAKRESALRIWDLEIETRLVGTGQAIIAGNFQDDHDLLSTLMRREGYVTFRRPSLHIPGDPSKAPQEHEIADPDRAVLTWPGNWTRDRLLKEYRKKPNRFRRIHLLDSTAERGDKLKIDWVEPLIYEEDIPLAHAKFFFGLDGAPGGESDDLDFFNLSIGALHGAHLDLIKSISVRADTPRQVQLVSAAHDVFNRLSPYGVVAIGAAKVAMDGYMRGAIEVARPDLGPKLQPVSTPGDKLARLEALGPYAQTGWLRVTHDAWTKLTSDDADRHEELPLQEEWRGFPTARHDDRLDGIDVLIRTANQFSSGVPTEFELEMVTA